MIRVIQRGIYRLIETKEQTKILILDDMNKYALIGGAISLTTDDVCCEDCVIATGNYRVYEVNDEPNLSDKIHLELYIGLSAWQGYLLEEGLPTSKKKKAQIIPTKEMITISNEVASPLIPANHGL
jgi:hypothetical protein